MIRRFPRTRTVINIRGCNGSGKTTLMRETLETFGSKPLLNKHGKVWAYKVGFEPEWYVLGRYEKLEDGCDTIGSLDKVERRLEKLLEKGNVLFEGILVSIISRRWRALAKKHPDVHFIFATLDTPLEKCIERRTERRRKMGLRPASAEGLTLKYRAVHRQHHILKAAGFDARRLSHEYCHQTLTNWMLEDTYGEKKK